MDKQNVMESMALSALAYKDVQPIEPYTCQKLIDDPTTDLQCFLRKRGDTLYITFRGSNSDADWRANLRFWKKKVPYDGMEGSKVRVHTGFVDNYKADGVRDVLLKAVTPGIRTVRVSGHSQGAALAVLCALDIEYNFQRHNIEVVVFGCPRIGNRAFMLSYNKRVPLTLRVENGNDIVTKIPFALMGYRHVGARVHIGALRLPGIFSPGDHYQHAYFSGLTPRYLPDWQKDKNSV
jgi:predicted lipase